MIPLLLMLATAPLFPVRAEPVEARDQSATPATRPSTGSGRTDASATSPIDAERAFAADAKTLGQWTAFRKWSTDDAVMFTPQPVNAHDFLKDRKDPPRAIDWWPTASYISCDGTVAVNTGGWKRADGKVGYFSTVWQRQKDGGWKWIVDGGDTLVEPRPRPTEPKVVRANCPIGFNSTFSVDDARMKVGRGRSDDGSLSWSYAVAEDGSRSFEAVFTWTSPMFTTVIDDKIPGSPPNK